ncbi:hypothetical protein NDU88_007601 [Pleurodeles waltl]|uniref:Uncharacterized protein n=1 Tax=Pleurodeles waltl TaxID=8319 RepID=A0AAV7PUF1_PLEWA|nr:hypothetical protein NDU88_007601 [Pleurodeles waltl]
MHLAIAVYSYRARVTLWGWLCSARRSRCPRHPPPDPLSASTPNMAPTHTACPRRNPQAPSEWAGVGVDRGTTGSVLVGVEADSWCRVAGADCPDRPNRAVPLLLHRVTWRFVSTRPPRFHFRSTQLLH